MKEYYNKYYVPNNMHLLIAGDFDKRDVKKLIKAKFGKLKKGADVEQLDIAEDDFSGREVVDLAITPYRVARFGYRTVKPNHEDAVVLDLISNIFSNSSKTGLLNKLNNENKVLGSYATTGLGGTDHGGFGFGFVPKDDTQSFEDGENLILKEIDKVKSGEFSEDLLQSIKLNMSMDKLIVTIDEQGNTSAASIPLALDFGIKQKKIKPGHLILMEAFGGGFTWGSALIRM